MSLRWSFGSHEEEQYRLNLSRVNQYLFHSFEQTRKCLLLLLIRDSHISEYIPAMVAVPGEVSPMEELFEGMPHLVILVDMLPPSIQVCLHYTVHTFLRILRKMRRIPA